MSLYFTPFEVRQKVYFKDINKNKQNYQRDFDLNQYLKDIEKAKQDTYAEYKNAELALNALEEKNKIVTGKQEAIKQLKKEGRIAEALALEGPKPYPQLPYDPTIQRAKNVLTRRQESEYSNEIPLLENLSSKESSSKKSSSKESEGTKSAMSLASEAAKIADVDKNSELYKLWKLVEKSESGPGSGSRKKTAMIKFALDNSLQEIPKISESLLDIRNKIIMQLPKKNNSGEGLIKKTKNKKYSNIAFYVHKKNAPKITIKKKSTK
jgi:hypothetical protein